MSPVIRAFSGGEISPSLYARADLAKYQTSVRTLRNFIAQRHGGATTRAGTEYAAKAKASDTVRLIPFISSTESADIYVLEMGDMYIRFHQRGAPLIASSLDIWTNGTVYAKGDVVAESGVAYYCVLAHTAGAATHPGVAGVGWQTAWYALVDYVLEIPTPYTIEEASDVQFSQVYNTMTFVHPDHPPQELTRLSVGPPEKWTLSTTVFGPAISLPTSLALSGGTSGVSYSWAITAVNDVTGEESLATIISAINRVPTPAAPTTITWRLVNSVNRYNVYRSTDGITFGFVNSVNAFAQALSSSTTWLSASGLIATQTGDMWVSGTQTHIKPVATVADKAADGNYTLTGVLSLTADRALGTFGEPPYTQGRVRVMYSRDGEVQQDGGVIYTSALLFGVGTLGPVNISGTVNIPDNGYGSLDLYLQPEVYGSENEAFETFDWTCELDELGGDSVTWRKSGASFADTGAAVDTTTFPPQPVTNFQSQGKYPSCVTHYQQRRIYANSRSQTGGFWVSRTASHRNFVGDVPLRDNSSFSFEIAGTKSIIVRHLADLGRLVALTATDEKVIEGETQTGILRPDGINPRTPTSHGASHLRPLIIGDILLYVQARGNQVRMLKFGADTTNADLTLMADHMFRGRTLVEWDLALTPDSNIWVVRNDGTLLGLTFLTDQDVWGWHRHDTDGLFKSVCVVPEGNEDRVYVAVQRVINGETVCYIERMATRAVKDVTDVRDCQYSDAGTLAFDGRSTDGSSLVLSTAGGWTVSDLLTITADVGVFSAPDVGKTLLLVSESGDRLYLTVSAYASPTVVSGYGEVVVPDSLRGEATDDWARCVDEVTGLFHLEGKPVSVLADGLVIASPNNSQYATMNVLGGTLEFDHPYSVIRVGLPFISDLETLDVDLPTATIKNKKRLVSRVVLYMENSADVWVGQSDQPTDDDPLNNLEPLKLRDTEAYSSPVALVTDDRDVVPLSQHNTNGRVFVRQVDPLPTTILMLAPFFAEE